MPVPPEFDRASKDFYAFLVEARDVAMLQTTHQSYTMTQGVLQAFRRRLSFAQAIAFANELPLLLRALFVTDWDPAEPTRPFESVEAMTREVQALRAGHNLSPDDAIACVATALRRHLYEPDLDELLGKLPRGAAEFWAPKPP